MAPTKQHVIRRMLAKTTFDNPTGCWLFNGSKSWQGYGWIGLISRKVEKVHRVSAMFFLGYDLQDKSIQVNHIRECPNRHCWNPEHLYLGNQYQNNHDTIALGHDYHTELFEVGQLKKMNSKGRLYSKGANKMNLQSEKEDENVDMDELSKSDEELDESDIDEESDEEPDSEIDDI